MTNLAAKIPFTVRVKMNLVVFLRQTGYIDVIKTFERGRWIWLFRFQDFNQYTKSNEKNPENTVEVFIR